MPVAFKDRSAILFGRQPDVDYLLARSHHSGVTAVVGRPEMGKSWLFEEFARQLTLQRSPAFAPGATTRLFPPPTWLVGLIESQGESSDILLRSVVDLYSRWLSDSSYLQQARAVYGQQSDGAIGKVGKAFGQIFKSLSKATPTPLTAVGDLVKEAFDALAQTNADLISGGTTLPRLQIDQGRELLTRVYEITGSRMVLIFDQWEKSPGIRTEANILDGFLRHLDDWPPCHIFIGTRPDPAPLAETTRLEREFPAAFEVYNLPPMHLDDEASESALIGYLRNQVAATSEVSDSDLLGMLTGYPGTMKRWTSNYSNPRLRLNTAPDLQRAADDANANRFPEFNILLRDPGLTVAERRLAMRLSLVPATGDPQYWKALSHIVLNGCQPADLDSLGIKQIIESTNPPTFGHAKRYDAAVESFLALRLQELREVCESLVLSLAAEVRDLSSRETAYLETLVALARVTTRLDLDPLPRSLCQAAQTLFGTRISDSKYMLAASIAPSMGRYPAVLPLLAVGLFNTLIDAKNEGDLRRRDALLDELRTLANGHPQDAAVRENLAMGLFNTLNHARQEDDLERRDALLDELRTLASGHPQDAAVREWLAKGVFNTLNDARQEDDLVRRDALLDELRTLANGHPQDAAVREWLAKGVFNTLNHARQEDDLVRRDALLDELRTLANGHPQDAAVRESLAKGLFNTLNDARQEDDLVRRDALLEELRTLANGHPQDAAVRERLAKGLLKTLNDAKQEDDLVRRNALLDELRTLASGHPQDAAVRENLAMGLFNTLNDAKQEDDLERRDALLDELRTLVDSYPEDEILIKIRELLESM